MLSTLILSCSNINTRGGTDLTQCNYTGEIPTCLSAHSRMTYRCKHGTGDPPAGKPVHRTTQIMGNFQVRHMRTLPSIGTPTIIETPAPKTRVFYIRANYKSALMMFVFGSMRLPRVMLKKQLRQPCQYICDLILKTTKDLITSCMQMACKYSIANIYIYITCTVSYNNLFINIYT